MIDDYGHHPTEIRATLAAARLCGFRRIHVLFQPHRYTRTHHLMDEFARAFHQADSVFVLDIYAASREADRRRDARRRWPSASASSAIAAWSTRARIERGVDALVRRRAEGDLVLTLGAGNVWQAGEQVLESLRARRADGD